MFARKIFLILLCLFNITSLNAQANDELQVRAVLTFQEKAWNAGDIDEFMQGYWQSDSLYFVGSNGITYGWQNTLNNYKRSYPDTTAMGKLSFTIIGMKRLSVMYYHVTGKWHLNKTTGDVEGYFTLLFKKIKGKWVIVSDHTS